MYLNTFPSFQRTRSLVSSKVYIKQIDKEQKRIKEKSARKCLKFLKIWGGSLIERERKNKRKKMRIDSGLQLNYLNTLCQSMVKETKKKRNFKKKC